jgi:nitroreductase
MDAIEALLTRRTIREYLDEPVSAAQEDLLLRCAMAGPTGYNQQSWRFVVVRDTATRAALSAASAWGAMLAQTPLVIAVCGDVTAERHPGQYWVQDASAATENILIAAHAIGLGAVWVGIHPREERVRPVRILLGLPEHVEPLGLVGVGHPAKGKPPSSRMDWNKVHHERW